MRTALGLPLILGGCVIATWERNLGSGPVGVAATAYSFAACSPILAATPEAEDVRYNVKDRRNYRRDGSYYGDE